MANLAPLAALFKLRPDRAADYLLAKGFQLTGPYWELDGPQHSRVFTVAHLAKLDVLTDIKAALQEAIDTGQTERWTQEQLKPLLQAKGWWGPTVQVDPDTLEARVIQQGSLRRLQTIYRTNLQTAYMAGRHRQALEQSDRAPWAQYLAVRDHRSRPAHAALHGQVFRLDSPAWAVISPPTGFNCRCRARYLSDRELANRGITPAEDVRILEREPPGRLKRDPLTGEPTTTRPVDPLTGETPARWLQRGVSVPDPLKPGERLTLWADPNWDHLPGSDGAERALVDKVMATATQLSDGIKEAVQAALRLQGIVAVSARLPAPAILQNEDYRAAEAGGPHAGWLENARATMRARQLRKAIASFERQIALHRGWIADPFSKPGVEQASAEDVARCVQRKWPADVRRLTAQRNLLLGLLEEIESGKGPGRS